MIVIKCNKVAESYDWFTKVGKGSFNLELYAKILQVKGVKSKVEFIKVK